MKRLLVAGTVGVLCLSSALASDAQAGMADYELPLQVKVVQKNNADANANSYSTIEAALASITGATPSNRFLIKVMPGVYSISGTTGLTLSKYVDIEGSGAGNTEITSTIPITSGVPELNDTATLIVPYDANPAPEAPVSIRNIKISNKSTGGGVALLIIGRAAVEDVVLEAGSAGPYQAIPPSAIVGYHGAAVKDPGASATFFGVTVSVFGNAYDAPVDPGDVDVMGIGYYSAATGSVTSSRITVSGGNDTQGLSFSNSSGEVRDSVIELANVYNGVATQTSRGESRITGSAARVLGYVGTDIRACAPAISGYSFGLHVEASVAACPLPPAPPTVQGPCFGCLVDGVYQ